MKYKYPRTYHFPWSKSIANDDKILKSIDHFIGNDVIMTQKMDGENTTCAKEYIQVYSGFRLDIGNKFYLDK